MSENPFAPRSVYTRYDPTFATKYGTGTAAAYRANTNGDASGSGAGPVAGPSSGQPMPSGFGSSAVGYGMPIVDDDLTTRAGPVYIDTSFASQGSIYTPRNLARAGGGANSGKGHIARTTVIRKGGGETWEDPTLLEWDPKHFRLFVGNLGNDVSDDGLKKAFDMWPTFVKARVIRDKFTTKSKGFGFVAFSDPEDFMKAWKATDGQYVGSRPVKLSKATTKVGAVDIGDRKAKMLDDALANKKGVGRARGKPGSGAPGAGAGRKVSTTGCRAFADDAQPYVRR